jgi:hypothetical protein
MSVALLERKSSDGRSSWTRHFRPLTVFNYWDAFAESLRDEPGKLTVFLVLLHWLLSAISSAITDAVLGPDASRAAAIFYCPAGLQVYAYMKYGTRSIPGIAFAECALSGVYGGFPNGLILLGLIFAAVDLAKAAAVTKLMSLAKIRRAKLYRVLSFAGFILVFATINALITKLAAIYFLKITWEQATEQIWIWVAGDLLGSIVWYPMIAMELSSNRYLGFLNSSEGINESGNELYTALVKEEMKLLGRLLTAKESAEISSAINQVFRDLKKRGEIPMRGPDLITRCRQELKTRREKGFFTRMKRRFNR